jgi:SAM-dependent methyltransferase
MVHLILGQRVVREQLPTCRSCGDSNLKLVLSLGKMPLANALLTEEQLRQPEPTYPLDLVFCRSCTLLQITETVPPDQLFSNYLYFSSFSETMLQDSKELAQILIESHRLNESSMVVELGSNDGYQLQFFQERKIPVLGIDPARNIAEVAEKRGIHTLCRFFGKALAEELCKEGIQADIIIAKNVLAHVADLNGFVEGIRILLKKHGAAVIEVPYVKDLIDGHEFDTVYHEHLCYFSLTSLDHLFRSHEIVLSDVERIPIHGGSLRLTIAHERETTPSMSVATLLRREKDWGLDRLEVYLDFGQEVQRMKTSLLSLLRSLRGGGFHLAAYGAAAKGTVLLNYCHIGADLLDFVVDVSPHKQGYYMPGVHLPIYPPSCLLDKMPDYTLILAWNLADEIMKQQSEYIHRGGSFIVPIPEPRILHRRE